MTSTPWAKTILRSRHAQRPDKVLSTLLIRLPRSILAEFNTHRVFSRNAASSRAIPIEKLIQQVMDDPFIPLYWGKNQKGMQADEDFSGPMTEELKGWWLVSRDNAVEAARGGIAAGLHKQIVNRLLEPWMWTIVCVSSTEWSNFLALRDHKDAEPHIQILAREVRKELNREDNIQTLEPGAWHLPFDKESEGGTIIQADYNKQLREAIAMSVACCASTSYKTVDGFDMTLEKAIELHDKLVGSAPLHASPAEHVAQADEYSKQVIHDGWENYHQHKNFIGFRQYRAMLPNENL